MKTTDNSLTLQPDLVTPATSASVVVARLSFSFAFIALLLIVILHFVKIDLAPAGHMLSEYAIGDNGWIMQLSFFSWALSCIVLVVSIRSKVTGNGGRIGLVLLIITGLALIMGGIFIIDSPYQETNEPTTHGSLHGLSAMIGLPAQAVASLLISYSLKHNRDWASAIKPVILFAHLTWISLVLMFASTFLMMSLSQGKFTADTAIGWFNRLLVLIYCGWLMIMASKSSRVNRNSVIKSY